MSESDLIRSPVNLFAGLPERPREEWFETLLKDRRIHIERILSYGHSSPQTGWYQQPHAEWVLLLEGAAIIEYADGSRVRLAPGDSLELPAGVRHRVAWTLEQSPTLWLAIHYPEDADGNSGFSGFQVAPSQGKAS